MPAPRRLNILCHVHLYPPDHCAGAEMMLHEIVLGLKARRHNIQVVCDKSSADEFEGIPIATNVRSHLAGADLVITHLDRTDDAIRVTNRKKPLVHLVHNDHQLSYRKVKPANAQLVVFNSRWLEEKCAWTGNQMVLPPPVDPRRYRTTPGGVRAATLVNLIRDKGADQFYALAKAMPGKMFMGVVGGYGQQIIPKVLPRNVILMPHTTDMRVVYQQTHVLLMPSVYESWGRVGIEAAASGIPTIAHPTPGLKESLGASGTFADRDNLDAWKQAITRMDDPVRYKVKSQQALHRSTALKPDVGIDALEKRLLAVVNEWESK